MAAPPGTYMPQALRQAPARGGGGGFRYTQRPEKENPWERLAFGAAQEVIRGGIGFGTQAFGAHLQEEAAKAEYGRQVERDRSQSGYRTAEAEAQSGLRIKEAEAAEVRKRELIEGTYENEQMLLRNFGGAPQARAAQSQAQAAAQKVYADQMKAYQGELEEYQGAKETAAQKERDIQTERKALYGQMGREAVDVRGFEDPFGAVTEDYDVLDRTVPAPGIGPPETTGGVAFTKPGTYGVGGGRLPLEGPEPGGGRIDEPLLPHGEWARTGEGQQPPVQVHRGDRPRPVSQAAIRARDISMDTGPRAAARAARRQAGTTAPSQAYPTSGRDVLSVDTEGEPPGGYTMADDYPPSTTRPRAVTPRERPRSTTGEVPDRLLPTTLREPRKPTTAAPKKPVAPTLEDVPLQETEGQKRVRQQRELAELKRETTLLTKEKELAVAREAKQIGIHVDNIKRVSGHYAKLATAMAPKGKFKIKTLEGQIRMGKTQLKYWEKQGLGEVSDVSAYKALLQNAEEMASDYRSARRKAGRGKGLMYISGWGNWPNGTPYATEKEIISYKKDPIVKFQLGQVRQGLVNKDDLANESLVGKLLTARQVAPGDTETQPRGRPGPLPQRGGLTGPKATIDRIDKLLAKAEGKKRDRLNQLRDDAVNILTKMRAGEDPLIDPETGQLTEIGKASKENRMLNDVLKEIDDFQRRLAPPPTKTPSAAGQVQPKKKSRTEKAQEIAALRGKNPELHKKRARDYTRLLRKNGIPESEIQEIESVMAPATVVDAQAAALRERAPQEDLSRWYQIAQEELGSRARGKEPVEQARLMVDQLLTKSRMTGTSESERKSLHDDASGILDNLLLEWEDESGTLRERAMLPLSRSDKLKIKQLKGEIRGSKGHAKGRAKRQRPTAHYREGVVTQL